MWKENPSILSDWPEEVEYVLAIDENGTTDLKGVIHSPNDLLQWFTISGILFNRSEFIASRDAFVKLKQKYWKNGLFKNDRVVFHSRDIRKKIGPFNPKIINYTEFLEELNFLLSDLDYKIYTSSIDKFAHTRQYISPYPVYELCLEFVIERFCRELNKSGAKGIIVMESRGKKENKILLETAVKLIENGNKYHDPPFFESIHSINFNPKRTFDRKMSFFHLEIADLVSYPIHQYVRYRIKENEYLNIENKIYNYPGHMGYGMKIFPKP
ncbi:DUF3800 domain-containing protein [Planomicrobium sp. YIM 101495]|uniref:DUF3800 domain-containing protein n=1 Tax=Planomicrobium sp. YIM 101495 TaxID=2665160 RepID=UPI0012B8EB7C|nr:DUF3800 domain-containing protein [Planomicrobium sp. YIM 101495]MTD30140.1 DUF3800 domain-containing protein [Planomicrobium sp. YIM 101495]